MLNQPPADPLAPPARFDEKRVELNISIVPEQDSREPNDHLPLGRHVDGSRRQLGGRYVDRIRMRQDSFPVTVVRKRRTPLQCPTRPCAGPVTLINSFVVAAGREETFMQLWEQMSAFFRGQPGFVGLRLHRALSDSASFRFVNIADWSSAQQFAAAHAEARFRELVAMTEWKEFPSSPALYEVVVAHPAGRTTQPADS